MRYRRIDDRLQHLEDEWRRRQEDERLWKLDLMRRLEEFSQLMTGSGGEASEGKDKDDFDGYCSLRYVDFDLVISNPQTDGRHFVEATVSCGEERLVASESFRLPLTPYELDLDYLRPMSLARRSSRSPMSLAQDLGDKLFSALISGKVAECFRDCQSWAEENDHGIRIRLDLRKAPEMVDYPWEMMWSEEDGHLAQSIFTPIVRYNPPVRRTQALPINFPLRMLVAIANPPGYSPLNFEREREALNQAMSGLISTGMLEVSWVNRATKASLTDNLRSNKPFHILHFIGHGCMDNQRGACLVLNSDHYHDPLLDSRQLRTFVQDCRHLRLITLNTCPGARVDASDPFAHIATQLVQAKTPIVVAMQFEISDVAAIQFSKCFYSHVARGCQVEVAVAQSRKELQLSNSQNVEWAIPVLHSQSPTGVVFVTDSSSIK